MAGSDSLCQKLKFAANFESPRAHREAQDFFDRIAEDYMRRAHTGLYNLSSLSFRRRQDIVSDLLRTTPKGGTLLDYGMGPAVFGPAATAHGLRYIGIDISRAMVELARAKNVPGAEYYLGDLTILERFTSAADTVLLIGLIDYLQEPIEALRRLSRCVRPGGRIIVSFRNHRSVPRVLWSASRAIWRRLHTSNNPRTAFEAPVLQNSFVPARDFIPILKHEGFSTFQISYLDCSPIFFNLPLGRPIWNAWRKTDEVLSGSAPSFMCASGALMAAGKR